MSESERRRKYRYDRVLIETERILDPQFDDAVVYLTGAQIEMLRNMTQYLNRLDTYVSEQFLGYYLAPTVEEYDDILAIVADLEEELMGNPNTIWGYKEAYRYINTWPNAAAGTQFVTTDAVASGSVVRVEGVVFRNDTSILTRVIVSLKCGGDKYVLVDVANPPADVWHAYSVDLTMEEGDVIEFEMQGVILDDDLFWQAFGSLMEVP